MPRLSAAEFSRLAGVSKVAISKLVNANPPRLIVEGGKLDTDNHVNAMYLARSHEGGRPKPATKKQDAKKPDEDDAKFQAAVRKRQARKANRDQVPRNDDYTLDDMSPEERKKVQDDLKKTIEDLMADTVSLDREKKVADIALKKAMEARHTFKLAQDKKTVVPRESVRRAFALLNSSLSVNVLKSPREAVPELFAMAKAGASVQDGMVALEKILGKAVSSVLEETADAI